MSGSTGNRASGSPLQEGQPERILNLTTARKMLPLVQRIVADILEGQKHTTQLQPELDRLDRQRRELTWPERRRRYVLREEVSRWDRQLQGAAGELEGLSVLLVDAGAGRVGFPTLVNNRLAYFAWWPGEDEIRYWHFADEYKCRTIPAAWLQEEGISVPGRK
jgi:hypothetical protein